MSSPELEVLLTEIGEQPDVAARLLERQRDAVRDVAQAIRQREPSAIVLVARGSSDNAAVYGRYLFEVCNRQLTSLAAPSGLTLYGRGPRLDQTAVIGVSQSGHGEDVIAYVREARQQGAVTVAIVNDEQSPLAQTAEWVLACLAGPELSVPATKTVTAQMTLLAMLSAALEDPDADSFGLFKLRDIRSQTVGMRSADADRPGLLELPEILSQAVGMRSAAEAMAQRLTPARIGSVIGRGFAFPPALEIALKLKETSYTRAEPFSAADFLHGPVALVEENHAALLLDVGGRSSESAIEIAQAVRQRGGQPALLRAGNVVPFADDQVPNMSLSAPIAEPFAPIVVLVLGQLLAVELALAVGLDPARPRGLRKVTSTR